MRQFQLERLEDRLLLSATAVLRRGALTIKGDGSDDAILVTGLGFAAGTVEVFHDADGDATVDTSLGVFTGVNNIHISSKGGDDAIGVAFINISGNLTIDSAAGVDCVLLQGGLTPALVGGNLVINTDGGEDYLRVDTFNIGGLFVASMGGENDMVHLQDLTAGVMSIQLGGGNDFLIANLSVQSGIRSVYGGGGFDRVYDVANFIVGHSSIELFLGAYPPDLLAKAMLIEDACYIRLGGT